MKIRFIILLIFVHGLLWSQSGIEEQHINSTDSVSGKITLIPKIKTPIKFDGIVDSVEWSSIDTIPMYSYRPRASLIPYMRTTVRVGYDQKNFYYSAICYQDPKTIQMPLFERDRQAPNADLITLLLDTYNDNENALAFTASATVSRIDFSVKNDAQGAPINMSWDSYWDAKVSMFSKGWMVEMRIPFSSLRFQVVNDSVIMGISTIRHCASKSEDDIYPFREDDTNFWAFVQPSKAKDVLFSGIKNTRPWYTSPYLLTQLGFQNLEQEPSGFEKNPDNNFEFGLDIQHAITDNLNMDVTFNTDFAQVEADDQVINLSRFSIFFPEKRRFFQERSGIMEFSFEDNNRLFYSRRIGINDGKKIPLWGGVRLVGRINKFDVGFMSMQSREKYSFLSENYGILRLRRQISKNNSYIGGIFTSRLGLDGSQNLTYGIDGIINLFKQTYVKVNLAQSHDSDDSISNAGLFNGRNRIYLQLEDRLKKGFNYSLSYSQVDKDYNPGIGFESRFNFKSIGDRISYAWFPEQKFLNYLLFEIQSKTFYQGLINQLESYTITPLIKITTNRSSTLTLNYTRSYDNPLQEFKLSPDVTILPKKYYNDEFNLNYNTSGVKFLQSDFTIKLGSYYEGKLFSGTIKPTYVVSKYLTLSGYYQYNRIRFTNSNDYISHLVRLNISTAFNVKLSVNFFIQYNSNSKMSNINLRLRYNFRDGNDFYFVYNEMIKALGEASLNLPASLSRTFILKYIHTFQISR